MRQGSPVFPCGILIFFYYSDGSDSFHCVPYSRDPDRSSMLVVPVACGMQMAKSYKGTLICAIIVAVCTTIAGLFLSYYAGLKPGGMIVLLEVAWFVVVMTVKSFNK